MHETTQLVHDGESNFAENKRKVFCVEYLNRSIKQTLRLAKQIHKSNNANLKNVYLPILNLNESIRFESMTIILPPYVGSRDFNVCKIVSILFSL